MVLADLIPLPSLCQTATDCCLRLYFICSDRNLLRLFKATACAFLFFFSPFFISNQNFSHSFRQLHTLSIFMVSLAADMPIAALNTLQIPCQFSKRLWLSWFHSFMPRQWLCIPSGSLVTVSTLCVPFYHFSQELIVHACQLPAAFAWFPTHQDWRRWSLKISQMPWTLLSRTVCLSSLLMLMSELPRSPDIKGYDPATALKANLCFVTLLNLPLRWKYRLST